MKTTIRQRAQRIAEQLPGPASAQKPEQLAHAAALIEIALRRERAIFARSKRVRRALYERLYDDNDPIDSFARSEVVGPRKMLEAREMGNAELLDAECPSGCIFEPGTGRIWGNCALCLERERRGLTLSDGRE